MTINWVRDIAFARGAITNYGYIPEASLLIYHMLRCSGYKWIWECDGYRGILSGEQANHIPDGNMETSGVTNWTNGGGSPSISKSTTTVYSGSQSLQVTGVSGDVIQSASISPPVATDTGVNFTKPGGSIIRLAKLDVSHPFSSKQIGDQITISGAVSPGNDGTFTIESIIDTDTLEYTNSSGVAEAGAAAVWRIHSRVHLAIWVNNPGSQVWNIDIDRGDSSAFNVGSFSGTTGWEIKHFDFTIEGSGNLRIYLKPQGTSSTIHIDGMLMFRSFYEFTNDFIDYVNGDSGAYIAQSVANEFESSNYTFVLNDVGKFLFLFDASGNFPKNTGCYEITSINSGKAVLALRSSTASLSTQDGSVDSINWRMVDIYKWAPQVGNYSTLNTRTERFAGFGLESHHISKWRWVYRNILGFSTGQEGCGSCWSAPEDTDLDINFGSFFNNGPSITSLGSNERNETLERGNYGTEAIVFGSSGIGHTTNWLRSYNASTGTYTSRQTMMFEDDGSWFFISILPTIAEANCIGLFGLVGQDVYNPGKQAHCHLAANGTNPTGTTIDTLSFTTAYNALLNGVGIDYNGLPISLGAAQRGYGTSTDFLFEQSNAQKNPFGDNEIIQPLLLVGGSATTLVGSEREAEGIYQGRENMTKLTTFGAEIGTGDSFSITGSTVTLTDAASLFTANMVGKDVTITGATTPGNNGTFAITSQTNNTLVYTNAAGATEAFTGTWRVEMAQYLHLAHGICIDWMEEYLV